MKLPWKKSKCQEDEDLKQELKDYEQKGYKAALKFYGPEKSKERQLGESYNEGWIRGAKANR